MMQTEDIPQLMQGLLMSELTPDQQDYLRGLVPESIPTEAITPIIGMLYACVDKVIRTGDTAAMQKLLQMSGQTAELRFKLDVDADINSDAVLDVTSLSTAELRRLCGRPVIDTEFSEVDSGDKERTDCQTD